MISFWPIFSFFGSSILFAARRSSKGTLNFLAMLSGVSPFATMYVFLLSAFGLFSATGFTGIAFRSSFTAGFVVAVPVASTEACEELGAEVDETVCGATPRPFQGVGRWYQDFSQTSDDEVHELLAQARASTTEGSSK